MVLPGHLAGGYLAARAVLTLSHVSFSPTKSALLCLIGTLAGEGPDIDLILYYFDQRRGTDARHGDHREYITHAPVVWLIGCLAIVGIGSLVGSVFVEFIGWMILAGSWSHLILDSIENGVPWLWPLSTKRFYLRKVPDAEEPRIDKLKGTFAYYWEYVTGAYLKRWTFYAEIVVTLAGAWMLFKLL